MIKLINKSYILTLRMGFSKIGVVVSCLHNYFVNNFLCGGDMWDCMFVSVCVPPINTLVRPLVGVKLSHPSLSCGQIEVTPSSMILDDEYHDAND